jgi:hypothetical protein
MGLAARAEYEAKYTPERNYRLLIKIYEDSVVQVQRRSKSHAGRPQALKKAARPGDAAEKIVT